MMTEDKLKKFEIYNLNNEAYKAERDNRWPLVYILKDSNRVYIGETTNLFNRMKNHDKSEDKEGLNDRWILKHNEANRSASYLMESDLINRAFADETYELVNTKMQTREAISGHEFYGKEQIKEDTKDIWETLRNYGIFKKGYDEIENEELFKYSPWKQFDNSQRRVINRVKRHIFNNENSFTNGSAGTGKTLLIIRIAMDYVLENDDNKVIGIYSAKKGNHQTFSRVVNRLGKFYKQRVKVISDLKFETLNKIDYLLIDEGQRLRKWHGFSAPPYFKQYTKEECKDELEWINMNNINYSIFYDLNQAFSDKDLNLVEYINENVQYNLVSQYRMAAGSRYTDFVRELLQMKKQSNEVFDFRGYDLKVFDDTTSLFQKVLDMNQSKGNFDNKSRMMASLNVDNGEWITQDLFNNLEKAKKLDYSDITTEFTFGEFKAVWNKKAYYNDWLEKSDVSEVGCVHTVQGRDFRYAGVMFGNDIKIRNGRIIASEEIKNAYFILLTRGIQGHGIYTDNIELREYIKNFIKDRVVLND